jgi:uncharacterized Zn finger protein (UPF0148 family)
MSPDPKDPTERLADIKNAAALLLKGGSLISEPCVQCGGVQVRFKETVTCVNCGIREKISKTEIVENRQDKVISITKPELMRTGLEPVAIIIQDKILDLAKEIKGENHLDAQEQKADVIERYLEILKKLRTLMEVRESPNG